jgi:hypothetical protein
MGTEAAFGLGEFPQKVVVVQVLLQLDDLGLSHTDLFAIVCFSRLQADNLDHELFNVPRS